jgi:hypothetical protein
MHCFTQSQCIVPSVPPIIFWVPWRCVPGLCVPGWCAPGMMRPKWGWMVRPEKWEHIVTKRQGTKHPRGASSQGRIIPVTLHPIFPGTHSSGTQHSGHHILSSICRVQGLSCPGFVVSRVCPVQGLSCPGLVVSRVCQSWAYRCIEFFVYSC